MTTTTGQATGATEGRPPRADARRNIAAILDAATECLARDPDATINQVAQAAGVGRVTLYGHFDSRATLVAAVAERAMAEADSVLKDIDLGGDPVAALQRLIGATWAVTHRYGALVVAAERALPSEQVDQAHADLRARAERLLKRGQRSGAFRKDLPVSWLVTVLHSVTHAAVTAVHAGELEAEDGPRMICAAMLGVTTPTGGVVPEPSG
ncbi:TetR/AcrR family transcriptional regulator [Nocardioides jensenii]|uniref:TetR/AcrR family transcriptional regulator n=1 Tax=Nocardioides jensenii TaxID=1843 RepID=UPI000833F7C8|nr:TetR/AcrR family transcriptional regulator [Nocardioides jensenii]